MTRETIIVTNCTNRKRVDETGVALSAIDCSGSLATVAALWTNAVRNSRSLRQAQDVYMGRGFVEARRTAAALRSPLYIVSAGLGVVGAADMIPSYDLTVSGGTNSLRPMLVHLGAEPSDWWAALTTELGKERTLRALLDRHRESNLLLAMPGSYLALIAKELTSLKRSQIDRLRIITSSYGQALLPSNAGHVALPYDERLEGSPYAGTRVDFAQRALRHFVEVLNGRELSAEMARSAVAEAMRKLKRPTGPEREKKSDVEILDLLRKNWIRFDGASTHLLRYLRDEAMVACEQSRFRDLWRSLRMELVKSR